MGLTICDVGPRDGLQNEPDTLAPSLRAELVNRLAATGLPRIEAASFVRDDRVPQMAGAEEVAAGIERRDAVEYAGLVINEQGFERLRQTELDRVNVTLGATDTFNRRNGNASLADATSRVQRILAMADRPTTATISVAFGCPFEGEVDPGAVAELAAELDAGELVGFHGHNTRNTGYANALAALEAGATVLDASIGGLGGCPYAPRATGNIATEDLVYLLEGEGVHTGVDLDVLVQVSQWLEGLLGRTLEGQVYRAGVS